MKKFFDTWKLQVIAGLIFALAFNLLPPIAEGNASGEYFLSSIATILSITIGLSMTSFSIIASNSNQFKEQVERMGLYSDYIRFFYTATCLAFALLIVTISGFLSYEGSFIYDNIAYRIVFLFLLGLVLGSFWKVIKFLADMFLYDADRAHSEYKKKSNLSNQLNVDSSRDEAKRMLKDNLVESDEYKQQAEQLLSQ